MELIFRVIDFVNDWIDRYHARGLATGPTYGEPAWEELQEALAHGEWQAARAALAASRDDWGRRSAAVAVAAECKTEPPWLAEWMQAEPESAEPHLVAGAVWTCLAWEARGGGYADTVTDRGAQLFFMWLTRARKALLHATKLAPNDPTPWACLIPVGRGLSLGMETMESCFRKAVRRYPQHFRAHEQLLQCKCEKWHGSHSEMWDFANEAVRAAPPGSPVCAMIAEAHIEHALNVAHDDGTDDPDKAWHAYWRRPSVERSLVDAFVKSRAPPHPNEGAPPQAGTGMALAQWGGSARKPAGEALRRVGKRLTMLPWAYRPMPARTLRRARRGCRVA